MKTLKYISIGATLSRNKATAILWQLKEHQGSGSSQHEDP